MVKLKILRSCLVVALATFFLLCVAVQSWSRLAEPAATVDVRYWADRAPFVFHARVLNVTPVTKFPEFGVTDSVATLRVDRWYRGNGPVEVLLPFRYPGGPDAMGHDCIDFRPGTYWLVFAVNRGGRFELIDDCEGALTVSPLLGPRLKNAGWPRQMETDFVAGLNDRNPDGRLASIQRLGGLKLTSSRDALHRVIENGSEDESKWAVYAALRTGDVTVLPKVKELLSAGDEYLPESGIAMELQNIADPRAVPNMIAILESAPSELTRSRVLIALGDKLKDRRAVPAIAAYLSDPDLYTRYDALNGLKNITAENACSLPAPEERNIEPQVSRCKTWWEQVGRFRDWTEN